MCSFKFVCLMVFKATFNNISVISWRSVLLVEETVRPREIHRSVVSHWQNIMLYTSLWSRFELKTSVVIGTDCIGSCKSSYHTLNTINHPTCLMYGSFKHFHSSLHILTLVCHDLGGNQNLFIALLTKGQESLQLIQNLQLQPVNLLLSVWPKHSVNMSNIYKY